MMALVFLNVLFLDVQQKGLVLLYNGYANLECPGHCRTNNQRDLLLIYNGYAIGPSPKTPLHCYNGYTNPECPGYWMDN